MKLHMYSIYDKGVEAYTPPFFARALGEALRLFSDLVNDGQSNISKHPDDFVLMHVGEFDDSNGMVVALVSPTHVVSALECVTPGEASPPPAKLRTVL